MSKKLDNTRIVTFKEDYKIGETVIFKKDETHAMHFSLADKLKAKGVKADYKEFDQKKEIDKAKADFEAAKKAENK